MYNLIQREDDKEETIRNRLEVYKKQTAAILGYFKEKGILLEVDGSLPIEQSYEIVRQNLMREEV